MSYTWTTGETITAEKLNSIMPTPTAADVGSALTVQKVPVQGATIVPEQTVTTEGLEASIQMDTTLFTVGTNVIATINGEVYDGVIVEEGIPAVFFGEGTYGFWSDSTFTPDADGTYTISLNVATYTYEYGLDPYPGVDAILDITVSDLTVPTSISSISMPRGTYDAITAKMEAGKPVRVDVVAHKSPSNGKSASYRTSVMHIDNFIEILATYDPRGFTIALYINSDGTLGWD